ncbi:MAG: S-methyl-5-thioribose-1-phosphate isomerase [candidate division WOR-3 bacterium]|nr:MAG: S-methyl-5-thioribose-1-phosphate isomerase [candidate division WOR-3 bacterium]
MIDFKTIEYNSENNELVILDQTRLPEEEVYLTLRTAEEVCLAIRHMKVRGAPLIGVTAAYGVVLAARTSNQEQIRKACDLLRSARPTAVNLSWAIDRMERTLSQSNDPFTLLVAEAKAIEREDKAACKSIGDNGAELISDNAKIMVHCNAGALATSGIGTALGVIYTAKQQGKKICVFSCETRPLLQGARLTSWELTKNGIDTFTICDNMAATFMPDMELVLVGADRIASNGDVANKIGTRGLAIIANYYQVPLYVAAPLSTFDFTMASGDQIPIEERTDDEVRRFNERCVVAPSAKICNPAFDVTPSQLVSGIITEQGIISRPYTDNIANFK